MEADARGGGYRTLPPRARLLYGSAKQKAVWQACSPKPRTRDSGNGAAGGGNMGGGGTRIASISGLRGVVGDGLDPPTVAEFAAAYAGRCDPGPIAIGHDGRLSAAVFAAAVEAAVMATGHDAIRLGPVATPTIGCLVRESGYSGGIQISASHNPPQYNGLKFFQRGGMVLGADQGRALLERWQRRELGWARWDRLGKATPLEDPDSEVPQAVVGDGGEEMVGDMHVLTVDEHRPPREWVGEEYAGVGQAPVVGVRVLVDVPQEHEEHERRGHRNEPKEREIQR